MDNQYTHILCVKVWSKSLNFCSTRANIESIIKTKIINNKESFTFNLNNTNLDIFIKWKLQKWEPPYNLMMSGDLITNSLLYSDSVVYKYTKKLLKKIEEELKTRAILSDEEEIVFTIVKPITERIPLVDTAGIV
jgi:hypothetical protein